MEKVTFNDFVVEKNEGSGLLVILIVQTHNLLSTILKNQKL